MKFSERQGYAIKNKVAQREEISNDLRNTLWNAMHLCFWCTYKSYYSNDGYGRTDYIEKSNLDSLVTSIWLHHYKEPLDTIPEHWEHCLESIRDRYFKALWFEVYDFLECVSDYGGEGIRPDFENSCNTVLDRENSAYRFINGNITEITSEHEIAEVEIALTHSDVSSEIGQHLKKALELMSDRNNPDYRNSIKESISAVEALAFKLQPDSGKFGSILSHLERSGVIHGALKTSFSALYGYTSDADGIRHALSEKENLVLADARFMLISCSAFINYVVSRSGNDLAKN